MRQTSLVLVLWMFSRQEGPLQAGLQLTELSSPGCIFPRASPPSTGPVWAEGSARFGGRSRRDGLCLCLDFH